MEPSLLYSIIRLDVIGETGFSSPNWRVLVTIKLMYSFGHYSLSILLSCLDK